MKKRTKISLVLSSAAAILLAGSIMAGGTYALFTSESKTNIAVSSGKVSVTATVEDLQTYSGKDLTGDVETDKDRIFETNSDELGGDNGKFAIGGTATYTDGTLTLDKMTPGDKVTFNIKITNNSNVAAKYRTVVKKGNDTGLFNGLEIKVGDEEFLGTSLISSYEDLGANGSTFTVPVEVNFPSDRGNLYQDKKCDLSFSVEAVQGNTFDGIYEVDSTNIQEYLDGQHGSLDNATLVLASGTYNALDFARATKYATSNTQYYIGSVSSENEMTYDEYKVARDTNASGQSWYVRNIKNLTLKAAENATVTVEGMDIFAGQAYNSGQATVYDYVLEKNTTGYFKALNLNNIKFEGINFTKSVQINSDLSETSIDGVTFKNCKFNIGTTDSGQQNQALRFYNGRFEYEMKNLVVYNCEFNNFYQGIYSTNIYGITSIKNKFATSGHNAIAIQQSDESANPLNHGNVIIKDNSFDSIGNRLFRFASVLADTHIVIRNNKNSNPKTLEDGTIEVVKANSLAEGITYDIHGNDWGGTMADENNGAFLDK